MVIWASRVAFVDEGFGLTHKRRRARLDLELELGFLEIAFHLFHSHEFNEERGERQENGKEMRAIQSVEILGRAAEETVHERLSSRRDGRVRCDLACDQLERGIDQTGKHVCGRAPDAQGVEPVLERGASEGIRDRGGHAGRDGPEEHGHEKADARDGRCL
jgi:hypothetical protein